MNLESSDEDPVLAIMPDLLLIVVLDLQAFIRPWCVEPHVDIVYSRRGAHGHLGPVVIQDNVALHPVVGPPAASALLVFRVIGHIERPMVTVNTIACTGRIHVNEDLPRSGEFASAIEKETQTELVPARD